MFLEECKYIIKEKKIPKYIIDDIKISSDSDRENSDEQNSDEETSDESNSGLLMRKLKLKKLTKIFFKNFVLYIKMTNNYYQKDKEMLQKEAR